MCRTAAGNRVRQLTRRQRRGAPRALRSPVQQTSVRRYPLRVWEVAVCLPGVVLCANVPQARMNV